MPDTIAPGAPAALGPGLSLTKLHDGQRLTLVLDMQSGSDCVLHWGLNRRPGGAWQRPPIAVWPQGTIAADGQAVRTPFVPNGKGERRVQIQLDVPCPWKNLPFVLYFPRENRWVKSGAADFTIPLPEAGSPPAPEDALTGWMNGDVANRQSFRLDGGEQLAVATTPTADGIRVRLVTDADPPLLLHWGVAARFRHEWVQPPENWRPAHTALEPQAARTPFAERDGLQALELLLPRPAEGPGPRGLRFVLFRPEGIVWVKSGGTDMFVPLFDDGIDARLGSAKLAELAEMIVGAEKGSSSWTLMHRFNLCHDLLDRAQDDPDALALLFAWLRYSAIRQLDWQRRFNTQPRDLSHAQNRLTLRLAGIWRRHGSDTEPAGCRFWARLVLTTLGRGGEGQRVRDEILQIMHRHHLKETSGTFIEEWHQKLHNNTTPDDVVICEAYLAFLRSNGNKGEFDRALEAGGVTHERLRGFERPIKTAPEFFGDRKNALIPEFENFLRILRSVHSGTDLETAVNAARSRLPGDLTRRLDGLQGLRRQPNGDVGGAVTEVRTALGGVLAAAPDDGGVRDLLFLDLALEEVARGVIERQNLGGLGRDPLVSLIGQVLAQARCSVPAPELDLIAAHWEQLAKAARDGRTWALQTKSVADRAAAWVRDFTDIVYRQLQPKAEYLGTAFDAAAWTIPLFSEEVVRGGPAFALSLLLKNLDPLLRKEAGLGGWQVVSPARAAGRVRVVDRLLAVQAERFTEPTVLIADAVAGSEEIPAGVTAVLTTDAPDLVSHVAVRARNAGILLATCYEADLYARLKGFAGKSLRLQVTPGGDVQFEEGAAAPPTETPRVAHVQTQTALPKFSSWVVMREQFSPAVVGGKSNNLNGLRGRLPDWIHLPASLAVPFGVYEKVLGDEANRAVREDCAALLASIGDDPAGPLDQVRERLLHLVAPPPLQQALTETWARAGLSAVSWDETWRGIQRVWASKWNERAYLSRRARGVPHEQLRMAVLIQEVVPADYAFVIHTVNPITGNRDELFAEVVLGLGETIVGNYPGSALGFVCRKSDLHIELLSFPGKSVGLYGQGVIFRSDSNGEDLEGFAGAGLYDSFLAREPEQRLLDYRGEKLFWDAASRTGMLQAVARIGLEIEKLLGSPQDIEGAVAGEKWSVVQTRPQVGLKPS